MSNSFLGRIDGKNSALKKQILKLCINEGDYSLADLSKELNTSIPTITKLVGELIEDGFLREVGKIDTNGGRRPSVYGLNPSAGYFVGVDIRRKYFNYAVTDFKGTLIDFHEEVDFIVQNSEESFRELCRNLKTLLKEGGIDPEMVLAYGFNLTGRVNNETGYCFTYFLGEDKPIASVLSDEMGKPAFIDNDSRAMTYGEYICGIANDEKNMLFINISWGLGMGMILDGKLSYGKSGFSGEVGHFTFLNNNQVCHCGKTGCLETGASGLAIYRIFMEKLKAGRNSILSEKYNKGEEIHLEEIIDAVQEEDVLAIETIEEIGTTLGMAIAGLINIFNPELIVLGGSVAKTKEFLLLPVRSSIQKHSLNIINSDTTIKFSKLGDKAGTIGSCMLSRSKLLGLL